tara:strand:+ start:503 stop:910 length:408 start_codon:yes stop_codon:yes gene_type:complete
MKLKMKNKLILFLCAFSTIFLAGCASITRGTTDVFAIDTTPVGVSASLSNGMFCTTPCTFTLPRKEGFVVTLKKEGYETVTANISPRRAGAGAAGMAGNVLLGGLIGVAVDSSTGAMNDLFPNPLVVALIPIQPE